MNPRSLAVRGRIEELKENLRGIDTRMRALVKGIDALINPALLIYTVENIDADAVESMAKDLAEQKREMKETLDLIKELEREL